MTFRDDLIKRQILIQRLAGSYGNIITSTLGLAEKIVNDSLDTNGQLWSPALYKRLKDNLKRLQPGLINTTTDSLSELVEYENKFISRQLIKHYGIDAKPTVSPKKIVNLNMTVESGERKKSIPNAYKSFYGHKVNKLIQEVKDGRSKNESIDTTKSRVKDLMRGLFKTQTSTLALTAVNHIAASTRTETYKSSGIDRVVWVSILDSSTCDDCEELDGQEFDTDEAPNPPEHWNCRCHLEPIIT